MNRLEESNDASLFLYIEDSAELQIYRPTGMLNKVHMHLCLYSISSIKVCIRSFGRRGV